MFPELIEALKETLLLIIVPGATAMLIGLPLSMLLFAFNERKKLYPNMMMYRLLFALFSCIRSIPFFIFIIALFPLTRWLVAKESFIFLGIVPLTIAAIPIFTLELYKIFDKLPPELSEVAKTFGATPYQALTQIYLPEAFSGIFQALTTTLLHLLGYSTIAGVFGAGGLGDLMLKKGYHHFEAGYVFSIIFLLIACNQLIQLAGHKLYLFIRK